MVTKPPVMIFVDLTPFGDGWLARKHGSGAAYLRLPDGFEPIPIDKIAEVASRMDIDLQAADLKDAVSLEDLVFSLYVHRLKREVEDA